MKFILLAFVVFLAYPLFSQMQGDQWVIGYGGYGSEEFSVMHIDFRSGHFELELHLDEKMTMAETSSTVCDSSGQAMLWTNGMQIFGGNGVIVADTIAFEDELLSYWDWFYLEPFGPLGFPYLNGALILPVPESIVEYSVLYHIAHLDMIEGAFHIHDNLEARVAINSDSSFSLLYKDSSFVNHEYLSGRIISTRHANGRDWWIVTLEEEGTKYFSSILDPSGLRLHHQGEVDSGFERGGGQTTFSKNGNYIARMDALELDVGQFINLFSFDRCSGTVERIATFHTEEAGFYTGVAFSPNERFLYADDNTHLWQWDLLSDDIEASQTLVDTFDGFVQPGWFNMEFGPLIEAPDGRIYIVPPAGSSEFLHVIERPNLLASDCNFSQHSIDLTVPNGRSAPNIPNFRLGPIDGSPCDTLGIDNLPVSRWRFEEDQPGLRYDILFTDLSFYNPEHWHWDFGDGWTSNDASPIHTFESSGIYEVCLTVSNSYGSDTECHDVEILSTSILEESENTSDLSIYPNPFESYLNILSRKGEFRNAHIQLFDMHGKLIVNLPSVPIPIKIFPPSLPSGMYMCRIKEKDGSLHSFKLMKN